MTACYTADVLICFIKVVSDVDSIEIVYPARLSDRLSLKQQHPRVRNLLDIAIARVTIEICTTHAFPDALKVRYVGRVLLECAEKHDVAIFNRLQSDERYKADLSGIVSFYFTFSGLSMLIKSVYVQPAQRASNFRGPLKRLTDGMVTAAYQCTDIKFATTYYPWLAEKLRYIYPLNLEVTSYMCHLL